MKTRNIIERSFELLKSRFRCIDTSGGTRLYTPLKCCDIGIAVVMYNLHAEQDLLTLTTHLISTLSVHETLSHVFP
jgi:hypothetical protein